VPDVATYLRERVEGEEQRTTALELFFDLVFVFAVTQLSHLLLEHLTIEGVAQTLFLLLVVWWAWIYTTWMTNWFDPDSPAVRGVLMLVTLASLFMAIGIPDAFGGRAAMFAAGYVGLQVVRNAFAFAASPPGGELRRTFVRVLVWSVLTAPLWLAGGLAGGSVQIALWIVALAIDYAGPLAGYWLPRWGRVRTDDWRVESAHFAERFQLFIIIALGESVVVTGATASGLDLDGPVVAAIAVAFLGSAALWWLYFNYVARVAQLRLQLSDDPGRLARDAYTYFHLPIVAGIIVAAVGDELVIAHPLERFDGAELAALVGGPALYLAGHVAFRVRMTGTPSVKRLAAAVACLAAGFLGLVVDALWVAVAVLAILLALIAWEQYAGWRRTARGEPTPIERLLASSGR